MAEFSCIYNADDLAGLVALVSELGMELLRDDQYTSRSFARISPERLFEVAPFPQAAYAYFEKDLSRVTMSKIESKSAAGDSFFDIDDLGVPEHLRLSVFLRGDPAHAGFFFVSYHPQFLEVGGQSVIAATQELKRRYSTLMRGVQRQAAKVHAYKQDYFVFPGAASRLQAGRSHTTYGAEFDAQVLHGLQKIKPGETRGYI